MEVNRKHERGYNQVELITNIISKKNVILDGKEYVSKIKNTKVQSTLNLYR